jgi:hypothetical protein
MTVKGLVDAGASAAAELLGSKRRNVDEKKPVGDGRRRWKRFRRFDFLGKLVIWFHDA